MFWEEEWRAEAGGGLEIKYEDRDQKSRDHREWVAKTARTYRLL
jgi:hypothetical protein